MEMKTKCEQCKQELKLDSIAFICSYECTFCKECAHALQVIFRIAKVNWFGDLKETENRNSKWLRQFYSPINYSGSLIFARSEKELFSKIARLASRTFSINLLNLQVNSESQSSHFW